MIAFCMETPLIEKSGKEVFHHFFIFYLLKCFHWKNWNESYLTAYITQAKRSDLYRIRNLCRIMDYGISIMKNRQSFQDATIKSS